MQIPQQKIYQLYEGKCYIYVNFLEISSECLPISVFFHAFLTEKGNKISLFLKTDKESRTNFPNIFRP